MDRRDFKVEKRHQSASLVSEKTAVLLLQGYSLPEKKGSIKKRGLTTWSDPFAEYNQKKDRKIKRSEKNRKK